MFPSPYAHADGSTFLRLAAALDTVEIPLRAALGAAAAVGLGRLKRY